MNKNTSIKKLTNWEHWPSAMFYLPNLPYAFYLALRAKHLTFFSAANPCIKSSGNGTESKYETILLVPEKCRPKSVLVQPNADFGKVLKELQQQKINFPLIAKPDVGFRGLLVSKISSEKKLKNYLEKYPINIIIQEFLDYENECGVFYHRNPNSKTGKISSLTLKHFLSVTGDGSATLKELILADNRAALYIDLFTEIHQEKLTHIPSKNEVVKLTSVGNHSKGTQFINGNHLISEKLTNTFDKLSNSIPGWYYGRVDLKYNSFEELENDIDFKVLEINGIIAEPTHMYDSKNYTYFKALKAVRTHWKSLFEIAVTNHRNFNISYVNTYDFINQIIDLISYTKKIKKLTKL
ncbi:D-alanine--D-alanine ligase [Tenacibaculum tangerinum]|uniref:D-alanine--D-alanine ligase n=1 Tax=Tenacibaculum tangerinum TaxID=3038772 RepID=A0ABY8L3A0_9FLAO|nr:D-alanine--D-alanine ligase [Tenacibaculum tangerinum]WGH75850.1 D-alanine--D-alanine ligase [Tenacibaculum tangerinum]